MIDWVATVSFLLLFSFWHFLITLSIIHKIKAGVNTARIEIVLFEKKMLILILSVNPKIYVVASSSKKGQ